METNATNPAPDAPDAGRTPLVVVGVADSEESDRAIRWGAEHVRRTGGTLRLVHAFIWPLMNVDVDPVPGVAGSGLRAGAETLVAHAVELAREAAPGIAIETDIVVGRAVDVLLDASKTADVLAVGNRGLGRMLSLVMGSTSLALARRAQCPIVVVRGDETTAGPVAVAYESTDLGEQAIERAGRLAAVYDAEVHVVIAVATPADEHDEILEAVRRIIGRSTEGVRVRLADTQAVRDARRLVAASEGSRLIVVPAQTESMFSASSATGAVVHYANTPVWIERPLGAI